MLAKQSLAFNVKNKIFRELFPDLVARHEASLEKAGNGSVGIRNSSSLLSEVGLTKRRGKREGGGEAANGPAGGAELGGGSSLEIGDKLAYGVLGVPLIALLLVFGYLVMTGL